MTTLSQNRQKKNVVSLYHPSSLDILLNILNIFVCLVQERKSFKLETTRGWVNKPIDNLGKTTLTEVIIYNLYRIHNTKGHKSSTNINWRLRKSIETSVQN